MITCLFVVSLFFSLLRFPYLFCYYNNYNFWKNCSSSRLMVVFKMYSYFLTHCCIHNSIQEWPSTTQKWPPCMDLLTLDHVAFTLYIMHSKLEPNKLTGKWKIFSKQPIKSFMTLRCEEDYFTITGSNHFSSTFCATNLVIFFHDLPKFYPLQNILMK